MKRMVFGCVATIAAHLSLACSGDDDGEDGLGGKQVSQLTQPEAQQLCQENLTKFNASVGGLCTAQGLLDGDGDSAMCESIKASCVSEAPSDCSTVDPTTVRECPFTVSALLTCLDEVAAWAAPLTCTTNPDTVAAFPECANQLRTNCTFDTPGM